jgi:hypothetical protein
MTKNNSDITQNICKHLATFRADLPDLMKDFGAPTGGHA